MMGQAVDSILQRGFEWASDEVRVRLARSTDSASDTSFFHYRLRIG